MSLSGIKNKLYQKETPKNLGEHDISEYDPAATVAQAPERSQENKDLWAEKKPIISEQERPILKRGLWAAGIVLGLVAVLAAAYFIRKASFSEEKVTVEILGSAQAKSGNLITYEIAYKNDNWVGLNGAELRIDFPENFKPENSPNFRAESLTSGVFSLGKIERHASGKAILSGKVYSPRGALMYLKASMMYAPGGYSSRFEAKNQLGINVISSPVNLELMAPQRVSSGDAVDYLINYKNAGEEDFDNIKIKIDYPEGFTFSNSDPKTSEQNNVWYIGQLSAGQEGKIVVSGKLEGNRDEIKKVSAFVSRFGSGDSKTFSEASSETKIASSPLSISQTVNGQTGLNVNAGENLKFEINVKNEGETGLRDVIVTEKIDSLVLDYSTLRLDKGSFDEKNKTITWKASDYPALKNLAPNQGGKIGFSLAVKAVIPIGSENDKNFVISSVAKIDSPDIATPIEMNKIIAGNKIDMKLNSKLVLDVKGYYNDGNIPNSGPLPPKVNEETTYTLHWAVSNISNDISNAKVETVLPSGVTMTGKFYPEDAKITYNERNNSLVWEIGNIKAATGILSKASGVSFQVKVKPSSSQIGREIELLGESAITAKDLFTGTDLKVTASGKNSNLQEDESLGGRYRVVN